MKTDDIKTIILDAMPGSAVVLDGDGCHFTAHVMSPEFEELTPVKKQQRVYGTVAHFIQDGTIHAFTVKTYTPTEWEDSEWSD